jgi:rhamnose utilization protein RhaD (predicted bifunctional aldolase and dehydrogenase)
MRAAAALPDRAILVGHIGYHDYEGPAVELDERERIVGDLGPHDALVMRNHGLLTCGATIQQAFNTMYQLELSCRSQVDAMAARTELVMPRTSISPARADLMACWNGRRCCACSRRRTATRAIRRIGIEISLDQAAHRAGRDRVAAARHRCGRGRVAGPLRRL